MALTNREKVLLTILIFAIVIGTFLYFLILPMIDKTKENLKVLEHDRIILTNLEQANKTGIFSDKEKNIQDQIKKIEGILPSQVRIPEIFLEILYISGNIGLQQESFTMQNTIIDKDINTASEDIIEEGNQEDNKNIQQHSEQLLILPINHIFKGTYEEIKSYIDEIQKCERKIDIVEYQISNNKEVKKLSASFLLHSYALVEDGQNYSDFTDYDFIKGNYGRNNPFTDGSFTVIKKNIDELGEYIEEKGMMDE